jgi:SNF2 family DNA or RNA helicase
MWSSASLSKDGQVIAFSSGQYDEVESRLQELAKQGADIDFLPDWVRFIVGFGKADAIPTLGIRLQDAKEQVMKYVESLPEHLQKQTPVLPYQIEGISFGLHRGGRVLIGDEMGLGKTVQALILAAQFVSEWPLLIVVPSSLRFVWRDQAVQWLPHIVGPDGNLIHVLKNGKDRAPISSRIIIGTYDLVRAREQLRARPDGRHFLVVIVDESHNIKDPGTQRSKATVGICKSARRVMLLSGTPTLNRASELYTQIEAVLPSDVPAFARFAERYCTKHVQRFGQRTVEKWDGVKRAEELNILLSTSVMIRRLKREVLTQLPSKRRMRIPLDPDRMQQDTLREVAQRVQKMSASELDADGIFDGNVNIAELFRVTAEAKLGAVTDYVEHLLHLGTKFLLFAHHHFMLDALQRKLEDLRVEFIRIDGKTAPHQRPDRVGQFQNQESVRVALLSITAAGVGLTLTAAHTVVFAELYWVPGQMQQAEDRAHRIGQRDCVTVQYLVAKSTLDDIVYRSLEKKCKNTSMILNGQSCGLDASSQSCGLDASDGHQGEVKQANGSSSIKLFEAEDESDQEWLEAVLSLDTDSAQPAPKRPRLEPEHEGIAAK